MNKIQSESNNLKEILCDTATMKKIIDDAPEEATHIIDGRYYSNNLLPDLDLNRGTVWSVWYSDDFMEMWEYLTEDSIQMYRDIQSIESLKKIVKHYEENQALKSYIAELEKAIMSNCYDDPSTSGKRLMALVTKGGAE